MHLGLTFLATGLALSTAMASQIQRDDIPDTLNGRSVEKARRDIFDDISSVLTPPKPSSPPANSQQPNRGAASTRDSSKTTSIPTTTSQSAKTTSSAKSSSILSSTPESTTSSPSSTPSSIRSSPTSTPSSSSASSTSSAAPSTVTITSLSMSETPSSTATPALTSALPASTTSAAPKASGSSNNGIKIAIGIVGALALLSLLILFVFWVRRSKRNREKAQRQAVLEENGFQRGVGYEELKGAHGASHDGGPIFPDERDPSIRRARQGKDAIPMTTAGSWGHRPNSFEAQHGPDQLNRGTPELPAEMPANPAPVVVASPAPAAAAGQSYVAYRPFASQYQPSPTGTGAAAGGVVAAGGAAAAAAAAGKRKPLPKAPVEQTEPAELESPVSPSDGKKSTPNFSRPPAGTLQIRNS